MKIIESIRKELKGNIDKEYREGSINFFKEKIILYGVRTPIVRKIAKKYFKEVKGLEKKEIFELVEILLKSGFNEEATVAFDWLTKLVDQLEEKDFSILEKWLKKYVDNWAKCDDFCTHVIGALILKFPKLISKLEKWTQSKNRWLRRAATVSFIYPLKKGKYLKESFKMVEKVLKDEDDLVQKGYGWTLKEASNIFQKEVFDFVMKRKKEMPRTALRYAIEKMPNNLRKKAM